MATTEEWDAWESRAVEAVGNAVRSARSERKISQQGLADIIGVSKGVIANLEANGRVSELPKLGLILKIAEAFRIPAVSLIYPGAPDGQVEALPKEMVRAIEAVQWFSGESPLPGHRIPVSQAGPWQVLAKSRELEPLRRKAKRDIVTEALATYDSSELQPGARVELSAAIDQLLVEVDGISDDIRELGGVIDEDA